MPPLDSDAPTPPRRWLSLAALALGAVIVLVFGLRAFNQWQFEQRVASGQVQVATLRGWMTLRYIAHTHAVPESALRIALGVPATGGDDRSLHDWFEAERIDPLTGRQALEAVILRHRSTSVPGAATPATPATPTPTTPASPVGTDAGLRTP